MLYSRKIYRKIAKENGISIKEVKNEIEKAIAFAYLSPNDFALKIPKKKEIPTIDEFISFTIDCANN